jgi:PBP1b-binding outer membrane lipoprotein LpoB
MRDRKDEDVEIFESKLVTTHERSPSETDEDAAKRVISEVGEKTSKRLLFQATETISNRLLSETNGKFSKHLLSERTGETVNKIQEKLREKNKSVDDDFSPGI